ncbi:response regulator transcription factor [uncultured Polaribacter sp.]|uniref:response regulator transcription factor n=1 Tax=uncultured Polaribacter sp. TaxID=174711 RepID=UPI00261D11A8|nr:response regulator transcription factor [uncultured Polaribacter sp.]
MKKKIYVHIADDHKILIDGLIAVLDTDDDIEVKGCSFTGQEVIDWFLVRNNTADILILDITMPVIDGIDVLKHFYRKGIKQKVIVLSSFDELKFVQEVLRLGGNGYISKNEAGEHILDAIKAVYNNEQYFSDSIRTELLRAYSNLDKALDTEPELEKLVSLTDTEIKVIKFISEELSTVQIAKLMNVSAHTIETHRKKLKKKLNVKSTVGLAMFAVKYGIV